MIATIHLPNGEKWRGQLPDTAADVLNAGKRIVLFDPREGMISVDERNELVFKIVELYLLVIQDLTSDGVRFVEFCCSTHSTLQTESDTASLLLSRSDFKRM